MRRGRLVALALAFFGLTGAAVRGPGAAAPDCSSWTLDGYRLGMRGDELLAVRSVTLHLEGQAQVTDPGKFHGVLVLDALNRLVKWDVRYNATNGESVRAEMRERLGSPISDVTGTVPGDEPDSVRQRRTIWWSTTCDAAIIVYENTSLRGSPGHFVTGTLVRASMLPPGLTQMKTLFY